MIFANMQMIQDSRVSPPNYPRRILDTAKSTNAVADDGMYLSCMNFKLMTQTFTKRPTVLGHPCVIGASSTERLLVHEQARSLSTGVPITESVLSTISIL